MRSEIFHAKFNVLQVGSRKLVETHSQLGKVSRFQRNTSVSPQVGKNQRRLLYILQPGPESYIINLGYLYIRRQLDLLVLEILFELLLDQQTGINKTE